VANPTDHLTAVRAALAHVDDIGPARGLVALRNAAPAIAALADECERLRRESRTWFRAEAERQAARADAAEAELAQARAHRCGCVVLSAEDADRIAALLEEQPGPTPAMLALFDKAKEE